MNLMKSDFRNSITIFKTLKTFRKEESIGNNAAELSDSAQNTLF